MKEIRDADNTGWSRATPRADHGQVAASCRSRNARHLAARAPGRRPCTVIAVLGASAGAARSLDDTVYDIPSAATKSPVQQVVIVYDDRSLSSIGHGRRRDVVGRLITSLRNAGAAVLRSHDSRRADRFSQPDDSEESMRPRRRRRMGATAPRGGDVILGYGFIRSCAEPPAAKDVDRT